jgi:hypothetical protein
MEKNLHPRCLEYIRHISFHPELQDSAAEVHLVGRWLQRQVSHNFRRICRLAQFGPGNWGKVKAFFSAQTLSNSQMAL